jgi:hypothetical protein
MCSRQEDERPATRQGIPDARETTEAVPEESVTRLLVDAPEEEVASGTLVEIALHDGEANGNVYAAMLRCPVGGDWLLVIAVADLLGSYLEQLHAAPRSAYSSASWLPLFLRLQAVSQLLNTIDLPLVHPYAVLAETAQESLLSALCMNARAAHPRWQKIVVTLETVAAGCRQLAERAAQELARQASPGPLRFVSLDEGLLVNNADDVVRGLRCAARLGLDLNQLEIGTYCGNAGALRGHKQ